MHIDRNKRWSFICSYSGIMITGIGIYLITFIIYFLFFTSDQVFRDVFFDFPNIFLTLTLPIIILMTLFLTISGIVLIYHEGFKPARLLGLAFGMACITGNLICRKTCLSALLACYITCAFFGTSVMGAIAVKNRPALDNDYLIILGCYIGKKKKLLPLLRSRLNRAIHFAWEQEIATGKAVKYVPSGGQGSDEIMSEGSAMEMYLISHGAEEYEILTEKESTNTYENMLFSKRIIDSRMKDARITYITTNYHVLRSGMFAKKAGLKAEGLASSTKWYYWPYGYIREFIAIMAMHKKEQLAALISCLILCLIKTFVL
ncbi:MAG: YdcF family protein [Lachnospiraceae bacterium]|nr:YdcF family protein [Lachnospiraceae bacterium]